MTRPPLFPLAALSAQIIRGAPKGSFDSTASMKVLRRLCSEGMKHVVLSHKIFSSRDWYEDYLGQVIATQEKRPVVRMRKSRPTRAKAGR